MKTKKSTKTSVKLRKCENRDAWMLYIEAYPVYQGDKVVRKRRNLNRTITSAIWLTGDNGKKHVARDKDGVIKCRNRKDCDSCRFAEEVRKKEQSKYDIEYLRSDDEKSLNKLLQAKDGDFIDFMKYEAERRHKNSSESILINWTRAIKLLTIYTQGKELPLKDIDVLLLENLKVFLLSAPQGGGKSGTLSQNSACTYFCIIKAALHQAFIDGYLPIDIASKVKNIPEEESKREYLTLSELEQLAKTPCSTSQLREAALFSALTGLRHSDIMKLTWSEIIDDTATNAYRISLKMKKTKRLVDMPISEQARLLCGSRREPHQRVFEDLTPPSWISRPLEKWVEAAGIEKHITFHCFRHTFATLQLANGTDIYTVSKMLGHTNVRTTQIYTKLVDSKKQEAANAIQIDGLTV